MWESSSVSPSASLEINARRRLLAFEVAVVRMFER